MLRTLCRQTPFALHPRIFILQPRSPISNLSRSASTPAKKHEYLVILPDQSGVLEKRMKVRPEHLAKLNVERGFWKLGGALLDEEMKAGEGPKINGSVMMAFAESREEVLAALKEDIYSISGVWDWEKVTIHPFKSAFIRP